MLETGALVLVVLVVAELVVMLEIVVRLDRLTQEEEAVVLPKLDKLKLVEMAELQA